jgi:hypothetical protein
MPWGQVGHAAGPRHSPAPSRGERTRTNLPHEARLTPPPADIVTSASSGHDYPIDSRYPGALGFVV